MRGAAGASPCRGTRSAPLRVAAKRSVSKRVGDCGAGHFLGACVLWLVVGLLATSGRALWAQGGRPAARPIGLDVSLVATKRLAAAQEFVGRGEWTAAIDALERLSRDFGDQMVEVEPGRFLKVPDAATAVLLQMSPPGLAQYRLRVDPLMQPVYERAFERRNPEEMRRVVAEGFASSFGDNALWWLGEEAWEQGDLDAARGFWTAMLPLPGGDDEPAPLVFRYPDTEFAPEQIRARLVLCSIMQGAHGQARHELEAFRALHPAAEGQLAGRVGDLAETLESILSDVDSRGLAGMKQPPPPQMEIVSWTRDLPAAELPLIERSRPGLPSAGPLAYVPVVWADSVLTTDGRSVWANRLSDGSATWPSGAEGEPGLIYSDRSRDVTLNLPTAGVPRFTGVVSEGRYYARMGPPVVVAAQRSLRMFESRLICLDLAGAEGRLAWSAAPDETLATPGWTFSGAPLVDGDSLFVPLRRPAPQMEIGVACLSASTGQLLWETSICSDLQERPATHHLVDEERLALGNGFVYRYCGSGSVAALERATGKTRWLTTYPALSAAAEDVSDERELRSAVPLFARGRLYLAPRHSDELLAIDAASGVVLWRRREPGRIRDLIAARDGVLIAAGDQLWGIECDSGRVSWTVGFSDPQGFGYGRGLQVGGDVYWTTREELFVVDAQRGLIRRRLPLNVLRGTTGGNLATGGGVLLIAQPRRLTAFGPTVEHSAADDLRNSSQEK
ncbi:MAG: hypothetical protein DWQ34_19440 [Planctomycetota bacterium]|nr:MAG: hypothetical protein DWQ29_09035 [Planctomycetota bacterium]REJ89435.1 MAG: hypothetical protein DWQ34_19440 [Planctomycetota bacterium]REK28996.1 MAG: hypothetical protein DWQ41_05480 [Planctomycetota bacterium]REK39572.1 MAG: hypothetical protein DWQ45_01465 [Planctomycetota bacterium]